MRHVAHFVLVIFALLLAPASLPAQTQHPEQTALARNGMVVAQEARAAAIGRDVLKKGGNAVDAAVAVGFALAVTHPQAGNIGGGGFMVVHPVKGQGEPTVFEYRETAPAAATKDMYTKNNSPYSHRMAGVPGTVRGLAMAHKKFGKLPWKDVVMPAVELAEKGFALDGYLANSLNTLVRQAAADHPE